MQDKIILIEECFDDDCIDIEVSGNHLFYANDILTHNSSSDIGMENTADSIGIAQSLDFFFALVATDELSDMDQVMIQVMKNRYGETNKFIVGLKKSRMQFFDVSESAQTSSIVKVPNYVKQNKKDTDIPLFDRSKRQINPSDFKF